MSKIFSVFAAIILFSVAQTNAQSLFDFFNSSTIKDVVTAVTQGSSISEDDIEGRWYYAKPAVEMKSEDPVQIATGIVIASQIELQVNQLCQKAGLSAADFDVVFEDDDTFACDVKVAAPKGKYTLNGKDKKITFHLGEIKGVKVGSLDADIRLTNGTLSILFDADRLLEIVSKLSSLTNNQTIALISSFTQQYDGMMMGAEFSRTKVQTQPQANIQ